MVHQQEEFKYFGSGIEWQASYQPLWSRVQWNQWRATGCLGQWNVPVYGLPQHQAVLFVEVVWELRNSPVYKVMERL